MKNLHINAEYIRALSPEAFSEIATNISINWWQPKNLDLHVISDLSSPIQERIEKLADIVSLSIGCSMKNQLLRQILKRLRKFRNQCRQIR